MTHKSPSCQAGPVEFEGLPEVDDGFEVLAHKGVVVANDAAGLRIVLVIVELLKSQIGQLPLVLLNVKDVRVGVHVFEAERISLQQFLEPLQADVELYIWQEIPWLL